MENPKKRFFNKGLSISKSQESKGRTQSHSYNSQTPPRESPRSSFDKSLPPLASAQASPSSSTSFSPRPRNFNSTTNPNTNYYGSPTSNSSSSTNSMSFDEVLTGSAHRRQNLMGAPRRAKSAERFDGLRVLCNTSPTSGRRNMPQNNLSRNSPASSRTNHQQLPPLPTAPPSYAASTRSSGGGSGSGYEPMPMQIPVRGGTAKMNFSGASSPPPPYSPGISAESLRGQGPPTYHQALAVAAAAAHAGKFHPAKTLASSRRAVRSFDNEFNNQGYNHGYNSHSHGGGGSGGGMRPTVSVPAFTDDVICTCSKCQLLLHSKYTAPLPDYNNDAVYMESQAFLMNEIMTDGMAFCTIV